MWLSPLLNRLFRTIGIPEDRIRQRLGTSPSDIQAASTDAHQNDPDYRPEQTAIDDQKDPTNRTSNRPQRQPNWRQCLRSISDCLPRAEVWLAIFTGVLVVETGISIRILSTSDEALNKAADAANKSTVIADRMREIAEANERAWVGPINGVIPSSIEPNQPVKVSITYANTGKELRGWCPPILMTGIIDLPMPTFFHGKLPA